MKAKGKTPGGVAAMVKTGAVDLPALLPGRGLHSLTSQLNLSAFYGTGGARRGCVARVKGV